MVLGSGVPAGFVKVALEVGELWLAVNSLLTRGLIMHNTVQVRHSKLHLSHRVTDFG